MFSGIYNKFRRITTNQLYFPEIDGIRFLAILLVVLFHSYGYFSAKNTIQFSDSKASYQLLNDLLINGDRGVELFFVLSGFILCLPFAHHYINNGKKVALKKYYLRRVTRLEPPYFLAMTGILLLHIAMHTQPVSVLAPHWLASLGYAHNIIYHQPPLLTVVAWSLEIEIQFYLVAPLLFRILALSVTVRRALLLAMMAAMVVLQTLYPVSFKSIYEYGQYFLAGILLADLYASNTAASFFNKKWMWLPALALLIAIIYWPLPLKDPYLSQTETIIYLIIFPLLLVFLFYIIMKNDAVKRVFSYKFVPIIGGMCYSIYLLHYTLISFCGRFTMRFHLTGYYLPNLFLQIVLLALPILVISSVFYLYIERPFMSSKWMDKLMGKDKKHTEANSQVRTEG